MEVLIENSAQKERKGGKLEDAFLGPYIIHESLGKGLYKVKNKSGVILKKKVNIARLKMYKERDDSKVKPLKAIFSFTFVSTIRPAASSIIQPASSWAI